MERNCSNNIIVFLLQLLNLLKTTLCTVFVFISLCWVYIFWYNKYLLCHCHFFRWTGMYIHKIIKCKIVEGCKVSTQKALQFCSQSHTQVIIIATTPPPPPPHHSLHILHAKKYFYLAARCGGGLVGGHAIFCTWIVIIVLMKKDAD